jgi:hypothetical protein
LVSLPLFSSTDLMEEEGQDYETAHSLARNAVSLAQPATEEGKKGERVEGGLTRSPQRRRLARLQPTAGSLSPALRDGGREGEGAIAMGTVARKEVEAELTREKTELEEVRRSFFFCNGPFFFSHSVLRSFFALFS